MARMTRAELNAAYEASRPPLKAYLKAVQDFRDGLITSETFVIKRRERDAALAAYDAAEARFLSE